MNAQRLNLDITIRLSSVDERGYSASGGLELREQVLLTATGFLEAAKILGQFHDLAVTFKSEKK